MNEKELSSELKATIWLFSGIFLALLLCYAPWLFLGREFVLVDGQYTYQPVCEFIRQNLKEGNLAFWNPRNYCGFSELAVTSPSLFYPLNFLLFLLPFSLGEAIYLLVHQFLAGFVSFLYVKSLTGRWIPAAFAAVVISLCGYFFAIQKYPDFAAGVATLLFCIWSMRQSVAKPGSALRFSVLAIFTALFIFSGRPELILPGFLFMGAQLISDVLARYEEEIKQRNFRKVWKSVWSSLSAVILGGLLTAPILLPGYEWLQLSSRSAGLRPNEVFQWSASAYDLFSMVFWMPFGDLEMPRADVGTVHALLKSAAGIQIPFLSPCFMGMGFFICLLAGGWKAGFISTRAKSALLLLGLFALLLALGDSTFFAPMLLDIFPKLAVLRYPVKLLIFFLLPLSLLAADGFNRVFKRESDPLLKIALIFSTALLVIDPLAYYSGGLEGLIKYICQLKTAVVSISEQEFLKHDLFVSFLVTALSGVAFASVGLWFNTKYRQVLLLTVLALPMVAFGIFAQTHAAPAGYYKEEPILSQQLNKLSDGASSIESVLHPRILLLISEPLNVPKAYLKGGLPRELAAAKFGRDILLPNTHFASKFDASNGYALAETALIASLCREASAKSSLEAASGQATDGPLARFCSLSSTRFVVAPIRSFAGAELVPFNSAFFRLAADYPELNVRVFEPNVQAKRFFFAQRVEACGSWSSFLNSLRTDNRLLLNDETTYIDQSTLVKLSDEVNKSKQTFNFPSSSVKLLSARPGKLVFLSRRKHPGLLVLRNLPYPGWMAKIDGAEVEIVLANLINQAVIVPAGEHQIVFEYNPKSLIYGVYISIAAALCLAFISFVKLRGAKVDA